MGCMHCLAGDPIEVGAATAVLRGGAAPLRFTAAKSRIGHAEPAAGTVGILHVSRTLPSPFHASLKVSHTPALLFSTSVF